MFKKFAIVLLTIHITGCAFSVYDVDVDYKYDKPVQADLSEINLEVGEVTDSRDVENPRMIMNQKNMYGQTTSGGWQAEKPLNEITKQALMDGLTKANAKLAPSSTGLELSGDLLSFDGDIIMGAWQGTYKGKLTVKLQLVDKNSGKIIWRDTFIGSGEVKGGDGVANCFKVALDDLVTDLLEDEYFLQKLEGE